MVKKIFSFLRFLTIRKVTLPKWLLKTYFLAAVFIGGAVTLWVVGTLSFRAFAANDSYSTWHFSSSSDYTLSSTQSAEISASTARLKVQNYESDANTKLLLHMDESSGNATDSSSYSNVATNSGAVFGSGNLNNAGVFDGQSSIVRVADANSLDLSSSNTLEAWIKFNQAFSAGSTASHAGVIDKGAYKLYFNSNTGKLQYELGDSSATSWTQQAGNDVKNSWDLNGKLAVHSSTAMGGNIYVGTGNVTADAEVWKWNGTEWSQIGGDGKNSGWADQTYESVNSIANDGTNVYAGLGTGAGDGEVWKWNGSSWTKIGGDGVNSGWAAGTYETINSLYWQGSTLYAGLGNSANDAEVWSWNGSSWTKIGGDSTNSGWTTNFEAVYSLTGDGTNLYAGLGLTAGDAEVWKWNGSAWSKIGGDAVNSSWADATYEYVFSLDYYGGNLYAGLGVTAGDAEVWMWNGSAWTRIGGDAVNSSWADATYEMVYSLVNDGTNLYAGLGSTAGDNEVWKWNGSAWSKIGGDGINSGFTSTHTVIETMVYSGGTLYAANTAAGASAEFWSWNGSAWTKIGGNFINKSWGFYNLQSVESMVAANGYMYAGTGVSVAGNAMVFQFDGSTWTIIGGQGVNSSWAAGTYETISSMVSYGSGLVVGLGTTANDAEVWYWNGSVWSQIGGDSLNSGWAAGYEIVGTLASDNQYLYAGLGSSANDAEVWRWNGTVWNKIGGDSTNSGWTTNFESVLSSTIYNGFLYVGLGVSAGDAEVWKWNGSSWLRVGGDAINSSWANNTYEDVDYLNVYDGKLYAGLGTTAGDAELWQYDGTSWTQIGGDDIAGSWTTGTYEQVKTIAAYNGSLFVGLGNSAGDGEVWQWDQTSWTKIGGQGMNSGWSNAIEYVSAASIYLGKLYIGTGNTANVDAAIWSWGNNAVLTSSTSSWDTNWHHVAATYDGATMKIYIDGVLDNSTSASVAIPSYTSNLLVGGIFGGREAGIAQGLFPGSIDELRISNTARSSFTTKPYSTDLHTVRPNAVVFSSGVKSFDSFVATTSGVGTVTFRLSSDGGSTWKYYSSGWTTSSSTSQTNSASTLNSNISTFTVGSGGILWQAVLSGNGDQQTALSYVEIGATADTTAPTNPDTLTSQATSGGTSLSSGNWYGYSTPYFAWSGASDGSGAGISGYYVYFGTDATAEPSTAGTFQVAANFTASSLVSGSTYYLRIKTKDAAQNVSATTWAPFTYKFDNTTPTNPTSITVSPAGYTATNSYTFLWPASGAGSATDSGSQVLGFQYKTGTASGALSDWSATTSATTISIDNAAYQTDANVFYLRTVDNAGNTQATPAQISFYYAGSGPSAPRFLAVNPSTNTSNSFAFSWQVPETYSGNASDLTYCYTVNTLPSSSSCTYTSAGATSLAAGSFATQVGLNTFYLAAKNGSDAGGAISYSNYASVTFTANTSAPGIPLNLDISDVSIKSTSSWRLAVSWTAPTSSGSGVSSYKIMRSTDDVTFSEIASTTGLAYIDTGLEQVDYYYKIKACDNVSNCGELTSSVTLLPTGRFTEAATLSSGPTVSSITTKKAVINWSTDRESDSKISYGVSPGSYYTEEPSNSDQTTDHEISLSNLSAGTTYYYKAKWTDEDGNTGTASEKTFSTESAPTAKEVTAKSVGLSTALIQFTVTGASSVDVHYGTTTGFGGIESVTTGTSESTYTVQLEDLDDDTKYYYKVNALDSEGNIYPGTILTFTTLPRPKISTVRIQQVRGTAQPTVLVTWVTNTETSSIITFYPESSPASSRDEINVALTKGQHKMLLRGLIAQTPYVLTVSGRDKAGNEAVSDRQRFTTATDTRPPQILNLKVEGTTQTNGNGSNQSTAQLVVSWDTDEPGTGQVEFGEGTGTNYSQKTQEEAALTTNHLVIISGLVPSRVYHLRAVSKDNAGNRSESIDTVTITPKAIDNALDLVISNLQQAFGFSK